MLDSISLGNFKSYREATLVFAPLTFMIGPNASGKSNALEAIRLLNLLARGNRLDDIERIIQESDSVVRGLPADLFNIPGQPFELSLKIEDAPEQWQDFSIGVSRVKEQLVITAERLENPNERVPLYFFEGGPGEYSDEISVSYNNFKKGGKKRIIPCTNRQALFYQLQSPGRFNASDSRSQEIIPKATQYLREVLKRIVFLDPHPALMRDYVFSGDAQIKENGQNLSAVLYQLCQDPQQKVAILNFIRSLPEQDITDISFIKTERSDVMVRLEESFGSQSRFFDAPLLSDGTLRVLAIGAALLSAPEGALLVVEEIDNGIHPSRARTLINQIQTIATERRLRVLLTSHNPALLDSLPPAAIGDVLCCYRDPSQGDSRMIRLQDLHRFHELVARGPLGYLMTGPLLDQYLKDRTTPKERKQASLAWPKQLSDKAV